MPFEFESNVSLLNLFLFKLHFFSNEFFFECFDVQKVVLYVCKLIFFITLLIYFVPNLEFFDDDNKDELSLFV